MKKFISLLLILILSLSLFSCKANGPIKFTIEIADGRSMSGELYPDIAPKTVENFVKLCNEDFYKDLVFHRVIEGFMIQGGGYSGGIYEGDFTEKPANTIHGEFMTNGFENTLSHERGVISMARLGNDPNSGSSQFFIMHEDNPSLDGNYAAFGKITEGLHLIDEIATCEKIALNPLFTDVPKDAIVIKTIRIEE